MNQKGLTQILTLGLIAALLIAGISFGYVKYFKNENENESSNTNTVVEVNEKENTNLNTNSSVNTNTSVIETACSDGWSTYTNENYGYSVMYPPTGTLSFLEENSFSLSMEEQAAGITFAEKFAEYGTNLCVSIKLNDSAYVTIAAPENAEAGVICHRSGVGVYIENIERTDSLIIDGANYTGTGDIYISEDPSTGVAGTTLMYHNETNHVTLSDSTSIEYGSTPAEDILYTEYESLSDILICILESYSST